MGFGPPETSTPRLARPRPQFTWDRLRPVTREAIRSIQSRSRTSSRDPLYRLLLVGLSLFLRNVWQWLVTTTQRRVRGEKAKAPKLRPMRYHDVLDAFGEFLLGTTQTHNQTIPIA